MGFAHSYAAKSKGGKGHKPSKGGGKGADARRGAAAAADADEADVEAGAAGGTGSSGAAGEQEFDLSEPEIMMQRAVEHLQHELAGVRSGAANPGLLESTQVEVHGERLPLKAVGAVTVRGPQLLAVSVFDPDLVASVVKAIRDSPLSLNPAVEGGEVLVRLPRLTSEAVEKLVKLVHQEAEGAHISIRRARQRGMDAVKRQLAGAAADERKRLEREVQRLHDKFIAEVDRLRKIKDAELREHKD